MDPAIPSLLALVDEAFEKKAWHGPNLKGALRGVGVAQAGWRPAPGRHNIWELVVHAAYWKYAVWRRLGGERRGGFELAGSNWFVRPAPPTLLAWRADVMLLTREHRRLRGAIARLRACDLEPARERLIRGIAAHDLYHAGQIQLLKRLAPR